MTKNNPLSYKALLIVWFAAVLISFFLPHLNPISWDAFGYYLYLPLTFIYHDLGIQHKEIIDHIFAAYEPSATFYQASHIPGGNWIMKYSMGMALLYSPGFFIAHLLAPFLGYPADGFSLPYQVAMNINSILFFIVGYWYYRKVLLHFFSDKIAALVLLLLFFGINYFYYVIFAAEISHNYLFAFYAMILWNTIKWHKTYSTKYMIVLAFLIGLAALARPTEIIDVIILAIGSLQIIYWKIYSGNFIYYSYRNPGEGFEFLSPYTLKVLFSFRKGWFIYTPLMLFAVAGFWVVYKQKKSIFFSLFAFFIINLYIVSSWSCWWYAQSMGQRALVQSYAVMGIPLGFFLKWTTSKRLDLKICFSLLFTFFVLLNLFQTWQMQTHVISSDRMTFDYYVKTFGKIKPHPEYEHLLLVQRLYDENGPFIKDESVLKKTILKEFSFEDTERKKGKHFTTKYAHSGTHSLMMDSTLRFSPSYKIAYKKMTEKYYAWIKISVWVYPVHNIDETPSAIVVTFRHKGKDYHYRAQAFNSKKIKNGLKLNQWNRVEMLYLTPEVRNKNDELVVYIWNRGKKDIYFDDLKIEMLEPRE